MCGIIFGANTGKKKEPINPWIIEQYEDQHSRGHEGFGLVAIDDKFKYEVKRSTEGAKLMYDLHNTPARIMMFHHRMPTSTPNRCGQTHPMSIEDGSLKFKYLVIHNGVISNAEELQKIHERDLGFVYKTKIKDYAREKFNDSESFAIEIARYIENQSKEVGTLGSVAFTALQIDKKTNKVVKLFFGRNINPLNMAKTRGILRLSSEGMGDEIEANKLYSCLLDEEMKLSKRSLKFKERPIIIHTTPAVDYHGGYGASVGKTTKEREIGFVSQKEFTQRNPSLFKKEEALKEVLDPIDTADKEDEMYEMLEPYLEEMETETCAFMEELYKPESAILVDIEEYVTNFKRILTRMADQALWVHTYDGFDKENPAWESSIPPKKTVNVSN